MVKVTFDPETSRGGQACVRAPPIARWQARLRARSSSRDRCCAGAGAPSPPMPLDRCLLHSCAAQGWKGRGVAGRQKVATPAGSRGAAKMSGSLISCWICSRAATRASNTDTTLVGAESQAIWIHVLHVHCLTKDTDFVAILIASSNTWWAYTGKNFFRLRLQNFIPGVVPP